MTEHAAVVRRNDRGVLRVSGADRLVWLQGLLTNDVASLRPGAACDAAYLTPQGRMISDMRVVHFDDATLLDVPAPLASALAGRLDALLFSEDAQIADESDRVVVLELHGPAAPDLARPGMVRDDAFELPGFCAFVPRGDVEAYVADLAARGAPETTLETLDVVRVEAGRPAFLVDMDEHTIPLEAGIEGRAVSFTKGCYVGQEVIVRVLHRGGGRVARKLVGLRLQKGELPRAGAPLTKDGREIGRVTSAVWSPAAGTGLALGYVHRDFVDPGTVVAVADREPPLAAEVAARPLVLRHG